MKKIETNITSDKRVKKKANKVILYYIQTKRNKIKSGSG